VPLSSRLTLLGAIFFAFSSLGFISDLMSARAAMSQRSAGAMSTAIHHVTGESCSGSLELLATAARHQVDDEPATDVALVAAGLMRRAERPLSPWFSDTRRATAAAAAGVVVRS
jgi:hypothetical protein